MRTCTPPYINPAYSWETYNAIVTLNSEEQLRQATPATHPCGAYAYVSGRSSRQLPQPRPFSYRFSKPLRQQQKACNKLSSLFALSHKRPTLPNSPRSNGNRETNGDLIEGDAVPKHNLTAVEHRRYVDVLVNEIYSYIRAPLLIAPGAVAAARCPPHLLVRLSVRCLRPLS